MIFIFTCLLFLGEILSPIRAELGIAYNDVTSCSSSVVEINSLSFDCNQATGCTLGDEVTMTGQCKYYSGEGLIDPRLLSH